MQKVVVVGAAVVDMVLKSGAFKLRKSHDSSEGIAICEVLGGKMEAEGGALCTGGGGTNVAVGLRRLGQAVKTVVRVGDDVGGKIVEDELIRESVDVSLLQRGTGSTGMSAVLVTEDGSRSIVTYRGEAGEIASGDVNWAEVAKADWIQVSSLGGEMNLLEDLVTFAVDRGIKIGINPGKKELSQKERLVKLLPKFDLFNVNRMEASDFTDIDFEDDQGMTKKMVENGARMLVMTDGKRGALVAEKRQVIRMEAYSNKSIDDTGAGDAFVSGLVTGILQGRNKEECLKMGLANGGSAVTKIGAKAGLLYKNEMEKWLSKKLKVTEEWI